MFVSSTINPNAFERVMIFVDGTNFLEDLAEFCKESTNVEVKGKKLNFNNFFNSLRSGRKLIRSHFYTTESNYKKFGDIFRGLKIKEGGRHIDVKFGDYYEKENGKKAKEKRVDTLLVVDLMKLAFQNAYDIAIILTGDKDFLDAIEFVKGIGKNVEVCAFTHSCQTEIMEAADVFYKADDILPGNFQ